VLAHACFYVDTFTISVGAITIIVVSTNGNKKFWSEFSISAEVTGSLACKKRVIQKMKLEVGRVENCGPNFKINQSRCR
jgi:hypothetical protein